MAPAEHFCARKEETFFLSDMQRQASIGNAGFAEHLAAGQQAALDNELMDENEDDRLEDIMADFPAAGGERPALNPLPTATLEVGGGGGVAAHDDRALELLNEKHPQLQSKACALKDAWARKTQLDSETQSGEDPYDMMGTMHNGISSMPEGPEKKHSVEMMNVLMAMSAAARQNEGLRNFLAEFFPAQVKYYRIKNENRSLDTKISMLTKLYNEQETQAALAALLETQQKRTEAVAEKGRIKAVRAAEKAATKEAAAAATAKK